MLPDGRLEVLVVGCGNIAGGFDAERPRDAPPLTHAGAFARHGGFVLSACVDPDAERRAAFMRRWDIICGAASIEDLDAQPGGFDVVSICSPTALHAAHLEAALALAPRMVFCEKPVTPSLVETSRWVARYETAGVPLAVNHTRRWAPDVSRLADELKRGAWGQVRSATGHYNKGILNNGSHMIDLLQSLLGPLEPLAAGAPVRDFWDDDPSVPAMLRSERGVPVQLNVGDAADYSLFEMQLVTSMAVIAMEGGGLYWRVRPVVESPDFRGYRTLDIGERRPGEYAQAMSRAAANLHAALVSGEALASTGRSACAAQAVCEALRRMAQRPPAAAADRSMENSR